MKTRFAMFAVGAMFAVALGPGAAHGSTSQDPCVPRDQYAPLLYHFETEPTALPPGMLFRIVVDDTAAIGACSSGVMSAVLKIGTTFERAMLPAGTFPYWGTAKVTAEVIVEAAALPQGVRTIRIEATDLSGKTGFYERRLFIAGVVTTTCGNAYGPSHCDLPG